MAYNVFGWTLNLALSIYLSISQFTSSEKCRPADNLTLAVVNRRYKIRDK